MRIRVRIIRQKRTNKRGWKVEAFCGNGGAHWTSQRLSLVLETGAEGEHQQGHTLGTYIHETKANSMYLSILGGLRFFDVKIVDSHVGQSGEELPDVAQSFELSEARGTRLVIVHAVMPADARATRSVQDSTWHAASRMARGVWHRAWHAACRVVQSGEWHVARSQRRGLHRDTWGQAR
jgi:hypothetical protein